MHVLLTGAAGLIGSEVAALLAENDHSVTALVHSQARLVRSDRSVLPALPWAGAAPAPGAVALIRGDVALPRLGLFSRDYGALCQGVDLIVHCAALTGFALDPALYRRVNVGGAANILDLARSGGNGAIPVVHVSTAYVCGNRDGPIPEQMPLPEAGFANGYEESKAAGERMVEEARREGMKIAVARPSIVVGDSRTGAIQQFCDVYRFIRLVAEGLIGTMPARAGATLDFVPVDHVARAIVEIAEAMDEAAGRNFHLVSGAPVLVETFTRAIAAFPHFHQVKLIPPERFRLEALPRAEQRLHRHVAHLYGSYLQRDPHFEDGNLRALTGRRCPPTDCAYFMRLLAYGIEKGFFRGGPVMDRAAA
jgi:2-alkyl-3-oxoalkanoate reductase